MEAVSSAKIWMKKAVNMKDLMQGVLSTPSVIHLPRSVCTSSKCNHVQARGCRNGCVSLYIFPKSADHRQRWGVNIFINVSICF